MENPTKAEWVQLAEYAEFLRALGHPVRLCIVRGLAREGSCNVSHMQGCLGLPQSTISQHLARLKAAGVIEGERQGVEVRYRLTSPLARRVVALLFPDREGEGAG